MELFKDGVDRQKLGRRLNGIRKYKGISSEALAEMLGKSSGGYIRMIESAQNGVSLDAFVDICNALDVSPEYLLSDSLRLNHDIPERLKLLHPSQSAMISRMIEVMIDENKSNEGS